MVDWPHYLPPVLTGTSVATGFNLYERRDDITHRISERREGYETSSYRVGFTMMLDEYGLFQAFWKEKLSFGMDWFNLRVPTADGNVKRVVRLVKGEYEATMITDWAWSVNFNVEVHPYA